MNFSSFIIIFVLYHITITFLNPYYLFFQAYVKRKPIFDYNAIMNVYAPIFYFTLNMSRL